MVDETPGPLMAIIQGTTAVPKAVAKLIDTVGDQIGLTLEPWHIRRKGRAEADARIEDAKAEVEVETIEAQGKLAIKELKARAAERDRKKRERRQVNVEKITADACEQMPSEVSDTPVEPDWTAQFFDHCQDISDTQMQSVWSRILAGEVAQPGSFSLRTLGLIKVLSKPDAERFERLGATFWMIGNHHVSMVFDIEKTTSYPRVAINYGDILALEEAGLIVSVQTYHTLIFPPNILTRIVYQGSPFLIANGENTILRTGKVLLTGAGAELANILATKPDDVYRVDAIGELRAQGWTVTDDFPPDK